MADIFNMDTEEARDLLAIIRINESYINELYDKFCDEEISREYFTKKRDEKFDKQIGLINQFKKDCERKYAN